jgi:4-aminobutyrate aminotransferase
LPYGSFFAPYPGLGGDEACCRAELDLLLKQQIAPSEVAAVIIEPVLGEGGFVPAPHGFLRHLRKWCDSHGALLIADEVQSGAGRTGSFYACETAGVQPNILTTAKGLASGYPLSAVVSKADIADKQPPGSMGGTYGGNAVSCAAAIATLDVFEEEGVLANVRKQGARATSTLETLKPECPAVVDVRGPGLMLGVEFDKALTGFAGDVSKECEALISADGGRARDLSAHSPYYRKQDEPRRGPRDLR